MTALKQTTDTQSSMLKRRLLGRGTVFLILALLVIGGWRLLNPSKVTIERKVEMGGPVNLKRKPAVADLLNWSKDLNLTATQESSLKRLLREEQTRLKPVEDEIIKVMQEFDQLAANRERKPASLEAFKSVAQPVSALSLEKRHIQQSFAERGLGNLNEEQKSKAKMLWEAKIAQITGSKKEATNP